MWRLIMRRGWRQNSEFWAIITAFYHSASFCFYKSTTLAKIHKYTNTVDSDSFFEKKNILPSPTSQTCKLFFPCHFVFRQAGATRADPVLPVTVTVWQTPTHLLKHTHALWGKKKKNSPACHETFHTVDTELQPSVTRCSFQVAVHTGGSNVSAHWEAAALISVSTLEGAPVVPDPDEKYS